MVLLHIICNDRQQADEIADLLVSENLVLSTVTFNPISVVQKERSGRIGRTEQTMLIGRTRSVLFNTVEARLQEAYALNMPVIYSVPIVNMNWQDANILPEPSVITEN